MNLNSILFIANQMNLRKVRMPQCGLTNLDGIKELELKGNKDQKKKIPSIESRASTLITLQGLKAQKSPYRSRLNSTTLLTMNYEKQVLPLLNKSMAKVEESNKRLKVLNHDYNKKKSKSSDKACNIVNLENSLFGKVI